MGRHQHGPLNLQQLCEGIKRIVVQVKELRESGSILLQEHPRTAFSILAIAFEELGKAILLLKVAHHAVANREYITDSKTGKRVNVWKKFWGHFYDHRMKDASAIEQAYLKKYFEEGRTGLKKIVGRSDGPLDSEKAKKGMLYVDFRNGQWISPKDIQIDDPEKLLKYIDQHLELFEGLVNHSNMEQFVRDAANAPDKESTKLQKAMFADIEQIIAEKNSETK